MRFNLRLFALSLGAFFTAAAGADNPTGKLVDKLIERKLDNVAVIALPKSIKKEIYQGIRTDHPGRLTFAFASPYFWASMGSSTAYKHLLFVSVMATDATDADYATQPTAFKPLYGKVQITRTSKIGNGTLQVSEGNYAQNSLNEPAHTLLYNDTSRRLQIIWHAVAEEMTLNDATVLVAQMAESFRIVSEPATTFAEMRERPHKEAVDRTRRLQLAKSTLATAGFNELTPGKPTLKGGMYFEWVADPEPRYQLLVPLGAVKVPPGTSAGMRPRPASLVDAKGARRSLPGTVGWYEFFDDAWRFSNHDNAYLPAPGIDQIIRAKPHDTNEIFFYYAATVRIEESGDDLLNNIKWFTESVAEVKQLWSAGKLVSGAH